MAIRVPSTFPVTVTDIWAAVNDHTPTASKALNLCYTNSNPTYFDPAYAVAAKTIGRFRNYGPPVNPPTYTWSATMNGSPIATDGSTAATECNSLLFSVDTTYVPDGTSFTLINTSGNFFGHYTINGVSNVSSQTVTLTAGHAQATVEFIVDRTVETTANISFEFRRTSDTSQKIERTLSLRDTVPDYTMSICGDWGPVDHSSQISLTINGYTCAKLKLIDTVQLFRRSVITGTVSEIKSWSYAEVDNGTNNVTLYFVEYGNLVAPDAIHDGGRYQYSARITDISGATHDQADKYVSCRVMRQISLNRYSIYYTLPSWRAEMVININTNQEYSTSGAVETTRYENHTDDPQYPTYPYAKNYFSCSGPISFGTLTNTATELAGNGYNIGDMNGWTIYSLATGSMFSQACGEFLWISPAWPDVFVEPYP